MKYILVAAVVYLLYRSFNRLPAQRPSPKHEAKKTPQEPKQKTSAKPADDADYIDYEEVE